MVDFKVFRYCSSVAFLELMIACGLPFIKVLGHDISIFDFISMSAEIDVLAEQFGEYEEFIIKEIVSWRAICVTGITLIVIEAVLVLIIKTTKVLFVMASGMVINNLMGFIFVDNISNFLKYINESIVAIFIDDPLKLENNPIIIWLIIHGLIFAAMIAMLVKAMWSIKKENKRFEMDNIVFDEIKDKSKQEDFYGAIICESGHYRNKVFFMKKDEVISFGSEDSDDVFIVGTTAKKSCCLISYEKGVREYIVQPLYSKSIFLESGQPLGKNRKYYISQGTLLTVDSSRNRFKLV